MLDSFSTVKNQIRLSFSNLLNKNIKLKDEIFSVLGFPYFPSLFNAPSHIPLLACYQDCSSGTWQGSLPCTPSTSQRPQSWAHAPWSEHSPCLGKQKYLGVFPQGTAGHGFLAHASERIQWPGEIQAGRFITVHTDRWQVAGSGLEKIPCRSKYVFTHISICIHLSTC